jgi:hypothetical protein
MRISLAFLIHGKSEGTRPLQRALKEKIHQILTKQGVIVWDGSKWLRKVLYEGCSFIKDEDFLNQGSDF